ncbi:MAG: hypothetical protein WDO19_14645 [Bacteroidota bacterium]
MFPQPGEYKNRFIQEILTCYSYNEIISSCDRVMKKIGHDRKDPAPGRLFIDKLIKELELFKTAQRGHRERRNILLAKIYLRLARLKETSKLNNS